MRLSSWLRSARSLFVPSGVEKGRRTTRLRKRAMATSLSIERLEDRTVPATFTVGNLANGGAVGNGGGTGAVSHTVFVQNQARGGAGGLGGNGGDGRGGGIYNGAPNIVSGIPSTLTVLHDTIVNNRADGGAAGTGGSVGIGQGGGVYNFAGGIVYVDLTTIFANAASMSDDEVFGILV